MLLHRPCLLLLLLLVSLSTAPRKLVPAWLLCPLLLLLLPHLLRPRVRPMLCALRLLLTVGLLLPLLHTVRCTARAI
jgi:hypothetical protein